MEFYAERLRLAALAEAEKQGTSFWTNRLPVEAGHKLVFAWSDLPTQMSPRGDSLWKLVQHAVQRSLGTTTILAPSEAWTQNRGTDVAMTYLEAAVRALTACAGTVTCPSLRHSHVDQFVDRVNEVFRSHRVSFKLVAGEVVPLESEELHTAVVEPVIYLLHGRPDLKAAQVAYMKALKEISDGDAADAITDAGTALQETLEALGCEGHSLGPLTASAKKRGLLGEYDGRMTDAIEKALSWAGKERNEGEAHHAVEAELSDAWLMVHVVGALIVRLAAPHDRPRGATN